MKNLGIGVRLGIGFGVVLLLSTLMTVLGGKVVSLRDEYAKEAGMAATTHRTFAGRH